MNRAERRRLAKAEQKKAKEKTLSIRPSDLQKIKQDATQTAIESNAEVLFTCFALVLYEQFGFGKKRILRAMQATDDYFGLLAHDKITYQEMQQRLMDGAGVEISLSDD